MDYLFYVNGKPTNGMGVTQGSLICVCKSFTLTNRDLVTTLGHELIHVYHNVVLKADLRSITRGSWRAAFVISEIEAYTWEIKMGNVKHGVWGQNKYIQDLKTDYKMDYRPKNLF